MAALFAHTLAGELTSRLRGWIADHFEFLSITGYNGGASETDVLTTAIMEGWMAGLGVTVLGSSDALGQLLSDYALKVYEAQLEVSWVGIWDLESFEQVQAAFTMQAIFESAGNYRSTFRRRNSRRGCV